MSYPQHPQEIIVKNEFYPGGLTEIDIWNHYQRYKNSILEQSKNRDIMTFIKVDTILVKRKGKDTRFIRLNNTNYDTVITGRTLSIHATMKRMENIAIVDIDTNDFNKAKLATKECYDVLKRFPLFMNLQIRFTGKTSFHIFCELSKTINVDSIRLLLTKIFKSSSVSEKYTISKARTGTTPNIDLFRNSFRGGFILLNSLSTIGLKCTKINYNDLNNFTKEKAVIY